MPSISRNSKVSFLLAAFLFGCTSFLIAEPQNQQPSSSKTPPPARSESGDSVSVDRDIVYGVQGGEKLLLDVYEPLFPSSTPRPAVVLIHGGWWTSLDKNTMQGMGNFLARTGFVAVSVNYRLLHEDQNRWPAQLDDVQRAVRWLRANASKYNIDPDRIGAFGHSAGAQLAALLGMEDTRDNSDAALAKFSSRVLAVVDVSGPTDFLNNHAGDGETGMELLFGGSADKLADLWRDASPVSHVAKTNAPFLIVHGTSDSIVPMAQAQELYGKLQEAGVPVSLVKVEDGHTFETPEARRRLALESLLFFNRYLPSKP
jgi:acetyl esterase/lipase